MKKLNLATLIVVFVISLSLSSKASAFENLASSPDEACGIRDNRSHNLPVFRVASYGLPEMFSKRSLGSDLAIMHVGG